MLLGGFGRLRWSPDVARAGLHMRGAIHDFERGVRLDARAYLLIRGWIPGLVRVELDDPDDPTPYWLVSTRHPVRLAAALSRGRVGAPPPSDTAPPTPDEA